MEDEHHDYCPQWLRLTRERSSFMAAERAEERRQSRIREAERDRLIAAGEALRREEENARAARKAAGTCRTCTRHATPLNDAGEKVYTVGRMYDCAASIPAMPVVSLAVTLPAPVVRQTRASEGRGCPRWVQHVPKPPKPPKPEPRKPIEWPGMSQRYWDALHMHEYERLPFREIGERLGVSHTRASQIVAKAERIAKFYTETGSRAGRMTLLHVIDIANHLTPPVTGRRRPRK